MPKLIQSIKKPKKYKKPSDACMARVMAFYAYLGTFIL